MAMRDVSITIPVWVLHEAIFRALDEWLAIAHAADWVGDDEMDLHLELGDDGAWHAFQNEGVAAIMNELGIVAPK